MTFEISAEIPAERRPYWMEGGPVGVLVLHGFMGSPLSSRPLADYLHARGLTVHCALLEGHGHLPARLHDVSHRRWLAQVEAAAAALRQHCRELFLVGHSMGCVLGAHLVVRRRLPVRGFAMVAPLYAAPRRAFYLLPVLRHVVPFLYPLRQKLVAREIVEQRVLDFDPTIDLHDPAVQAWLAHGTRLPTSALDEMRRMADYGRTLWPHVGVPALVMQGGHDEAVDPHNVQHIFSALPTRDKRLHIYPQAGHELTRAFDGAHSDAWARIYAFIAARSLYLEPRQPATL